MKSTHHLNVSQRVGVVEQAVNVTKTEELIKQTAKRSSFSAEALQRSRLAGAIWHLGTSLTSEWHQRAVDAFWRHRMVRHT